MGKLIQLDLFEPRPTEIEVLRQEVKDLNESLNKQRKALFARHGALGKMYIELHQRLEIIERNICQKKE
jgi:hypothetical protein